jgi:hypothetical protein
VYAVVAHQVSATETNSQRLAAQGRTGRAGPLRVEVQVGLAGVATVTDAAEYVPGLYDLSRTYCDAPPLQMPEHNPYRIAFENHVIANHVRAIDLGRRHVSRAILRDHDLPRTRCYHRIAIDQVRLRIGRKQPLDTKTDAVDPDKVNTVTLSADRVHRAPSSVLTCALIGT